MPYRDRQQVERWVADFLKTVPGLGDHVSVLDRDFIPGDDTGMVVVGLRGTSTVSYLQPTIVDGRPLWVAVFEPRHDPVELAAPALGELARDVSDLATLCRWLQRCTDEAMEKAATR